MVVCTFDIVKRTALCRSLIMYTILFITACTGAALVCHFGNLMPWYFLFRKFEFYNNHYYYLIELCQVDVAIIFIFILPTGIVKALTNQSIGKQVSFIFFHLTDLTPRTLYYYAIDSWSCDAW